jgi:carbon-monoxide dehydrogenase large subunit
LIGITQGGWDATTIAVEPDGRIRVTLGQTPMGQGVETAMAQMAADAFGVRLEDVSVHFGDTDTSHYTGYASGASRAAGIGGSSLLVAADKAKEKLRAIAAHLLEAAEQDVELVPGGFGVPNSGTAPVSLARIAAAAYQGGALPEGMTPGLEFLGTFDPMALAFSYGVAIALVELDAGTGQVTVRRLIVGHDCGNQLNPAIVENQVIGGTVQGMSTALLEDLRYDATGQPLSTSLRDYPLPLATDIGEFDLFHTVTPTPFSLNGAKGVGESGTIAAPAAIVNAIQDALPSGAPEITAIPVRPERILDALSAGN